MSDINAFLSGGELNGRTLCVPEAALEFVRIAGPASGNSGWASRPGSLAAIPRLEALHVYWRNGTVRDGLQVFEFVRKSMVARDVVGRVVSSSTVTAGDAMQPIDAEDLKELERLP